MKCPICNTHSHSFVHCPDKKKFICWDHCRSCEFNQPTMHQCMYSVSLKIERIRELQRKRQAMNQSKQQIK